MKRYGYCVVVEEVKNLADYRELEKILNKYGKDGWEMVEMKAINLNAYRLIFKKGYECDT